MKNKTWLVVGCIAMLLTLSACSTPRSADGKLKIDQIITLDDFTIQRKDVNIPDDLTDQYAQYGEEDEIIIPSTTFGKAIEDGGWFSGIIVWPIAQAINWVASFSNAGMGIIVVTLIIQILIFLTSIKSQVASQKMQSLQPKINQIQAKYAGKDDQQSRMQQGQEMQKLYKENNIKPLGTMLVTFIQLPVMFGVYQATMRASSVIFGDFFGISLFTTPKEGIFSGQIAYAIIFGLMVIFQLLSFKIPQWLQKHREAHSKIKKKDYAQPAKATGGLANSMGMMMYFMTGMIALLGFSWPLGMSFYYLISSLVRVIQSIVIHKFFLKD